MRKRRRRKSLPLLWGALLLAALAAAVFLIPRQSPQPSSEKPGASFSLPGSRANPESSRKPESSPSPEPSPAPSPSPTPSPTPPPPIPDDGSSGYLSAGLYLWKDKAFELFYGDSDAARTYAEAVSSYCAPLAGLTVYNMVVPNHSEFGLPERIREEMGCTSQRENTGDVYRSYSADVRAVDIYRVLDDHKDEYLYFHTDTHWAPLGAYYAYTVFCEQAGVPAAELEDFRKTTVEGVTGYLYDVTGEDCLAEHPDHIDLYEPAFSYIAALSQDGVSFTQLETLNSPEEEMGYAMFIWGDNPCMRIVNEENPSGRRLALVKDSYGNAMAPFLAASFQEVHVIDFRSFPGNLPEYCRENGVTDVLFLNNVMSANTYSQIEAMNGLFA